MEKLNEYLKEFNLLDTPLQERINEIINYMVKISPEEIKDVFISEYITSEGQKVYENLWGITESFVLEAKNFRAEIDIDLTKYTNKLNYMQLKTESYDFENVNQNSRMTLYLHITHGFSASFKATGLNCRKLDYLIKSYFKSNIV